MNKPKPIIRLLEDKDVEVISAAFMALGWNKPISLYEGYWKEQAKNERTVFVAHMENIFTGYITVRWNSYYPPFIESGIPEIMDFNVLPRFRRLGIGTLLMNKAEETIRQNHPVAGIGVGMTSDYGAAQQLYVKRGYIPDGRGAIYYNKAVEYGQQLIVNDDLVLYFTRALKDD